MAVRLTIVVVVFAVEAFATSLGASTDAPGARILFAVGIITVGTAIMVVVTTIEAHPTGLVAADMAAAAVALTVFVVTVPFAVVIVVAAIKALATSLGVGAVTTDTRVLQAV